MNKETMLNTIDTARSCFNSGDLEGYVTSLYAPDVTFHYFPPELPQGRVGARLYYGAFLKAFPDAAFYAEDIIFEGDKLVIRYHLDGTHLGEFNGIPASGKQISLSGITIMRCQDGQVVERWNETDFVGLLQQMGVMPAPEAA